MLKFKIFRGAAAAAILAIVSVVPLSAAPQPVAGDPITVVPGNLIANPGFEAPYVKLCCHTEPGFPNNLPVDEVQVPQGWRAWWIEPDSDLTLYPARCDRQGAPPNCMAFHRPEWRDAAAGGGAFGYRIRSGQNAQKYFTFYSIHEAGMYQQVGGVAPGQRLKFGVYIMGWSTTISGSPTSSGQQSLNLKVGIDPTGGTDPFSPNVVWTLPNDSWDAYNLFTVEATAKANTVTVYTSSRPVYPLVHNDIYLDDAFLVVVGSGAVTPVSNTGGSTASNTGQGLSGPFPGTTRDADGNILYVISTGDTAWNLSRRFNTTVAQLAEWNKAKFPDITILRLGKTIIVGKIKK